MLRIEAVTQNKGGFFLRNKNRKKVPNFEQGIILNLNSISQKKACFVSIHLQKKTQPLKNQTFFMMEKTVKN